MEIEYIEFLESIIEQEVQERNRLISGNQIKQKIHSMFIKECEESQIVEKLRGYNELFEIKEGFFVSKKEFYNFFQEIKDDLDIIKKISRKYLKKITEEEYQRLVLAIENNESIINYSLKVKNEHSNEKLEESVEIQNLELEEPEVKIFDKNSIKEMSEKYEVEEDELIVYLETQIETHIDGDKIIRKTPPTLSINLNKIINKMQFIEKRAKGRFNSNQLRKILMSLLDKNVLNIEEIINKFWLYEEKISKEKLEKILSNEDNFKRVDFERYTSVKNMKYRKFKADIILELEEFKAGLKEKERIIFEERMLKKHTLEEAGKKVGVTRERVRQISKKIERSLRPSTIFYKNMKIYIGKVISIFEDEKILSKEEIMGKLRKYKGFEKIRVEELMVLFRILTKRTVSEFYDKYYSIIREQEIEKMLLNIREKAILEEEFIGTFTSIGITSKIFIDDYIEENIQKIFRYKGYIYCSDKKLTKELKLEAIFKLEKRELNLKEIRNIYNEIFNEGVNIGNLNNTLLDSDKFVRVFTGIYQLTEWGGEKHRNSSELAVEFMKEKKMPLSLNEIAEGVKDKTRARIESIKMLVIESKETFNCGNGQWGLLEWLEDEELVNKYDLIVEEKLIDYQEEKEEEKKWTYDLIVAEGLKTGSVNKKLLENINFDEEDEVEDYYDAVEELENRGIRVE